MISEHLEYLELSPEFSDSTVKTARKWLSKFGTFCGKKCPAEMSVRDLNQWHKAIIWTPGPSGKLYSEATTNQAVGAVRRFYRWGLAAGKLREDPTVELWTPKAKKVKRSPLELSPSDARKLLLSPDLDSPQGIRDRAILALLLETRISKNACSRIDIRHLQFDTGALLTKGRYRKIHSLSDGVLADIERYLQEARPLFVTAIDPALFLNRNGSRLSGPSVQQTLNQHRKNCGL